MYAGHIPRHRRGLHGRRVLVVEDEALVAMLVEDAFLDEGANILGPACTVYDALRLIDEAQIDGLIDAAMLDLNFAGEKALPVADKLAACGIPFVIASGYGAGCDRGKHSAIEGSIRLLRSWLSPTTRTR